MKQITYQKEENKENLLKIQSMEHNIKQGIGVSGGDGQEQN